MRKGKSGNKPPVSNNVRRKNARKGPADLSGYRPARPLQAKRGSYWRKEGDVESWLGFDVDAEVRFEILVDAAQLNLRAGRTQEICDFAMMPHAEFAAHPSARAWITQVFGATTLAEIDGEIDRLARRAATGLPYGADNWVDGQLDFEGHSHACLQHVTGQTRTSAFVTGTEVVVDHWWYHPQYDEEPNTRIERYRIAEFMNGEGQDEVLSSFGTRALDRILQDCRAREPRRSVKDIREGNCASSLGGWIRRIGKRIAP